MSRTEADSDDVNEPRFEPAESSADAKLEPGGVIDVSKDGRNNWGLAARWFIFTLIAIAIIWGLLAIAR